MVRLDGSELLFWPIVGSCLIDAFRLALLISLIRFVRNTGYQKAYTIGSARAFMIQPRSAIVNTLVSFRAWLVSAAMWQKGRVSRVSGARTSSTQVALYSLTNLKKVRKCLNFGGVKIELISPKYDF